VLVFARYDELQYVPIKKDYLRNDNPPDSSLKTGTPGVPTGIRRRGKICRKPGGGEALGP